MLPIPAAKAAAEKRASAAREHGSEGKSSVLGEEPSASVRTTTAVGALARACSVSMSVELGSADGASRIAAPLRDVSPLASTRDMFAPLPALNHSEVEPASLEVNTALASERFAATAPEEEHADPQEGSEPMAAPEAQAQLSPESQRSASA